MQNTNKNGLNELDENVEWLLNKMKQIVLKNQMIHSTDIRKNNTVLLELLDLLSKEQNLYKERNKEKK